MTTSKISFWQKIKSDPFKYIFLLFGFLALIFISFYYLYLTKFPIGDDPAHHVQMALNTINRHFAFDKLKYLNYPIPIILFALIKLILGLSWPITFLATICFFLFLTCFGLYYFVTKTAKNWLIGISSAIILSSSRWVMDALRTGLMAEVWSWFIFIITSYFLVKRNLILLLIFTILLAISHPLVFMIFLLIAFCYSLVLITNFDKEKLWFLLKYWGILIVLIIAASFIFPEKIKSINTLIQASGLVGARDLKTIMIEEGPSRIITYLFSGVGLIFALKNWKKDYIKYFLVLLVVSILLTQSYQWGVKFFIFRFYPYFEIATAFFAAYGLVKLVNTIFKNIHNSKFIILNSFLKYALVFTFTFLMIVPNLKTNTTITNWQLNDYSANAMIPLQDLETINWVKDNIPKKADFIAETRWGSWLEPIARVRVYENETILNQTDADATHKRIKKMLVEYVFIAQNYPKPVIENNPQYFELIYQNGNSKIYKVK